MKRGAWIELHDGNSNWKHQHGNGRIIENYRSCGLVLHQRRLQSRPEQNILKAAWERILSWVW